MKNKLLIILNSNFPYNIVTGGQQAVFHMIRVLRTELDISILYVDSKENRANVVALKKMWKDVSFISCKKNNQLDYYRIKNIADRGLRFLLNKIFKKNLERISGYNSDLDPYFISCVNELLREQHFDIVQTEFYFALNMVYGFPSGVKKVFVQHEIRFVKNERLAVSLSTNFLDKSLLNKCKAEEIAAMNQYDAIITLTDIDKNILRNNGVNSPIYASPAIIYEGEINEIEDFEFDKSIVFLGGSAHTPNYNGIIWFLEHVWAKFSNLYPDINFKFIGNWDIRYINEITSKYKSVHFLGFVPELEPILRNSIMVVPLQVGSGMRMKILDAVRCGCPFVSTAVGVEGLNFEDGHSCLIADNSDVFLSKLTALVEDSAMQKQIRKNAFKVFNENYSEKLLKERRLNVYKEVVGLNNMI